MPQSKQRYRTSRPATYWRRSDVRDPALGGVRATASRSRAQPCRQLACAGRRDSPAQRAGCLHPPPGRGVDLGGTGERDHRVEPGREGRVFRSGRGQGLPPSDVLRSAGRRWSSVTTPGTDADTAPMVGAEDLFAYLLRLGDDALITAQRLGEWSARAPEM